MHITSSPLVSAAALDTAESRNDDRLLRTLMEADAPVRAMLLNHVCDGDERRRERLSKLVEAALDWRAGDQGARLS